MREKMREKWPRLVEVVMAFSGIRVVVVGDLVLDRFWYGAVQRVSREAPVPIVRLDENRLLPGCAANTVWNLAALGAKAVPVGVVGKDPNGLEIIRFLQAVGVDCAAVERLEGWATPTKTRVLAGALHGVKQQLVRIDSGDENPYPAELRAGIKEALAPAIKGADGLILSDYGYGLVEVSGARDLAPGVPVSALDSRFSLASFRGLTTATPNEEEFEAACGRPVFGNKDLFESEAEAMRKRLEMKALLVTRGKRGMSLFEKGESPIHLPIVGGSQVVDVTGAGDTVISTFVLALCAGATFVEAAHVANVAGGIVVQKHGTATTSREELARVLKEWGEGRL